MAGLAADQTTGVRTDVSRFPLVVVTPPETVTDEQMHAYIADYQAMQQAFGQPFALILDLRWCKKITPAQRKMLTDDMKKSEDQTLCRGVAMVFDSRLLRGILTAIFWVQRPPYPTRVFGTPEEAEPWANALLTSATTSVRTGMPAANETSGTWVVQAPASLNRTKAQDLVRRMKELGYTANVQNATTAGREVFVPRMGPFSERAAAVDARAELQNAKIDAVVLQVGDSDSDS